MNWRRGVIMEEKNKLKNEQYEQNTTKDIVDKLILISQRIYTSNVNTNCIYQELSNVNKNLESIKTLFGLITFIFIIAILYFIIGLVF